MPAKWVKIVHVKKCLIFYCLFWQTLLKCYNILLLLFFQMVGHEIELDNDQRSLSYYSVETGDNIVVKCWWSILLFQEIWWDNIIGHTNCSLGHTVFTWAYKLFNWAYKQFILEIQTVHFWHTVFTWTNKQFIFGIQTVQSSCGAIMDFVFFLSFVFILHKSD